MRQEKQLLLDEIKDHIEEYNSFIIMNYSGLDANATAAFRDQIVEMGGNMEVVKKRVLLKAAQAAGIELDSNVLEGHIGIVFAGADPIQATQAVFKLKKDTKAVNVLGGRFEGQLYNADDVEKLSKLPGKDEMRAQLLSVLEAPLSQTVAVMNSVLCSVLYCLENKCKESSSN